LQSKLDALLLKKNVKNFANLQALAKNLFALTTLTRNLFVLMLIKLVMINKNVLKTLVTLSRDVFILSFHLKNAKFLVFNELIVLTLKSKINSLKNAKKLFAMPQEHAVLS
jgi:hypothetical protein